MSIVTMGYVVSGMAVALMAALVMWMEARGQSRYYQDLWQQTQTTSLERLTRIGNLEAEIRRLNSAAEIRAQVHARVEKDLATSHALTNHYLEEIADLEALITAKDDELGYQEEYIKNGETALRHAESEKKRLQSRISELEAESPEHVRACLLEKANDCANLTHLNNLLQEANAAYCRELKEERAMVDHLLRQLQDNNIEPDLEPCEAATSAEPDPAEEPIEVSCCF